MNIFVVNSGSSSIKYQLFKMPSTQPVCSGLVERIGMEGSAVSHKVFRNGEEQVIRSAPDLPDHEAGLLYVAGLLTDEEAGIINNADEIEAVGHRVVHGGESFSATTVIDAAVKGEIQKLFPLAPLHNPANYLGIAVAEKVFPKARQVAVFDTAFHQTMPPKAYRFAIPRSFYTDRHIRSYGFHGTSYRYIAKKTADYLRNPSAKIIAVHLGNGCSITAIDSGKSVDTSMGFGPLSGLIMGTRSGDIDPSVIFHLTDEAGYELDQVKNLLNKRSGMAGLTGFSDMRDVLKAIAAGNAEADLAYDMYAYRIKKYIGAYVAVLNGLDAVVFTAGVGENDPEIRRRVCNNMQHLGLHLDEERNKLRGTAIREINDPEARVKLLVIPANEELEIAGQCYELLEGK